MKHHSIYFFIAVLLILCAPPGQALIVLGGDAGHTNAPPDDPGWDNVGYVRANWTWNQSRASGVYIGDGWVLTAYHVIYYDAPTGIVFNAEPNKAYPIDVSSYVRLNTNSFTRLADSPDWIDPTQTSQDYDGGAPRAEWTTSARLCAPNGADLAMFRLTEYPDIEPARISKITKDWLTTYLGQINNQVTAIATGRPRLESRSYWTENFTETTQNETDVAYSGYKDWPDMTTYNPICRWGKNYLYYRPTSITHPVFGSTICLQSSFQDYGSGGNSNTFQMARLDSGGGVFYKGTGEWELLGLLTSKQLPNGSIYTTGNDSHPFGSYSLISDLAYYRDQIMKVTEWPDLSVQLVSPTNKWLENGQQTELFIITSNQSANNISTTSTGSIRLTRNGQTVNDTTFQVPALQAGESFTNLYSFQPDSFGTWKIAATADAESQIFETIEGTLSKLGYAQNNLAETTFYTGPDLKASSLSPDVTNTTAGALIFFEASLTNAGNASVTDSFTVSLYRHTNDTFTTMTEQELEAVIVDSALVSGLAINASNTIQLAATAPNEPGNYYLRARIDSSDKVDEADESNNWGYVSQIRIGQDLKIDGSLPRIARAGSGSNVVFQILIRNAGAYAVQDSFEVALYLTAKNQPEFPQMNVTNITVDGLSEYETITKEVSVTAPNNSDIYYLQARVDTSNTVFEVVEINNQGPYSELRVGPDLAIEKSFPGTKNAVPGEPVSIQITVENLGASNITNAFDLGLYAIHQQTGQGQSDPIWTRTIGSMPAETSTVVTATFTAPTGIGSYLLISKADNDDPKNGKTDAVDEYREDNNESNPYARWQYSVLNVAQPSLSLSPSDSSIMITWKSFDGTNYQIQSCENLLSNNWTNFGPVLSNEIHTELLPTSSPQKFYRIIAP